MVGFDEQGRWLRVRRGRHEMICNFSDRTRTLRGDRRARSLLATAPATAAKPAVSCGSRRSAGCCSGEGDLARATPFPLGATWDGQGTNFSLYSAGAEGVELCLFDERGCTKSGSA